MNILFVLPVLSDSYYQKRIYKMSALGVKSTVLGFERDHYKGKSWSIPADSLGYLEHGYYIRRLGKLLKAIFKIRSNISTQEALYAFNLDILLICWAARLFKSKKIKLIYDVADIRSVMVENGLISVLLRSIERLLVKRTSVVVVSSPAYIDGYFKDYQNINHNFVVIENKVDKDLPKSESLREQPDRNKNCITIGYFGMLRCEYSLSFLKKLIKNSDGSIRLMLRGVFLNTEQFENEFNKLEFAHYGGPFIYPDDVGKMYSNIDLVWAAHLHGKTNTKWSISNRFYQACYFNKPLIAQSGTMDAKRVNKYDIGCVLDLQDFPSSIHTLQTIANERLKQWEANLKNMPQEVYTFTDEHKNLLELIKNKENQS